MKKRIVFLFLLMIVIFVPRIYAACEEGSYKVTYNANGGTGASSPTCVTHTLSSIKPTRSGYKFLGWTTSKNSTEVLYYPSGEIELTRNITLYAVWSKGYKITYDPVGGSVKSDTKTVYPKTIYGSLLTPTRKGFEFLGWFTQKSGGDQIVKTTMVTNTKPHTLYAHWKKIKYTINYELNGGTISEANKEYYYVTTSTFELNNPTKKGYRFLGWYTDSKYKNKIEYVYKGTTGNKTLYARWTPIKYSIYYYGNGNTSGSTEDQIGLKYNKTYVLNANGFKKKGYVFGGWNTKKDATGKSYVNKQEIKNLTASNGKIIKLFAIWKRKEYTITYVLNGGVNPEDAPTVYTLDDSFTLKTPTRDGYKFLGWYSDEDFTNRVTRIEEGTKGNKTFYAKWKFDAYRITYVLNGGVNPDDAISTYKIGDEFDLPLPTKKGYSFKGWYLDQNFTNRINSIGSTDTGNKTVYAKWEIINYNINYVLNGGVNPDGVKTTYTVNDNFNLINPTKDGNVFLGWYTDQEFENEITNITPGHIGDITLYAQWEAIVVYNITYNLDGGVNPDDAPATYIKSDEIILPTPTKIGYTFKGWYTESTFTNLVTTIPRKSSGDITFYAKWEIITYAITYNLNGGTNPSSAPTTYNVSETITLPTPTKTGYTFNGWYTESTFTNKVTNIESGTTGNKTYYAKWTINNYTITYNLDGGTNPSGAPTTYTVNAAVTLPTPAKTGYTFNGWYTESTFTNRVTSIAIGSTGNKTFYAKWTIINYNITYNLNGGTNPSSAPTTYTVNSAVTLPTPTKTGYTFNGWYTESTFTNRVTSIASGTTGNKTFYAKWTIINYNITYNLNGGTNPSSAPTTYNVSASLTLPTPTKTGYTFEGWYTESTFTNLVTTINAGTTGNKTYYAKWSLTYYTISYEVYSVINLNGAVRSYTINDEVTLPTNPARRGRRFDGWFKESTYINKVTTIPQGSTGDKTFHAKWYTYTYNITYNLNGGTNPSSAPTSYTVDSYPKLPTPTKTNQTFAGWYSDSALTNKVEKITWPTTGDQVLYAKWTSDEYLINYVLNGGANPSSAPTSYSSGNSVTLPTPTRKGYSFQGWYTESTFTNRVTSISASSTGNKTFYAKWKEIVYYINYEVDDGVLPSDSVFGFTVNDEVTLPIPTKTGYGFLGWYKESTFVNKITKIAKNTASDQTVYAKWQQGTVYNITYILNGGTNPIDVPTTYTQFDEVELPTPTKSGYGFAGWYTESSFTNRVTKLSLGTTGNKTLYAKWGTPTSYTITYNLNGGTNPSNAPTTYTQFMEVTLPTPTKTGYIFEGWYTESTFINRIITIAPGTTGNKTYYAKWIENTIERSYSYSFYNNTYDNKFTSLDDMRNTMYNILNEGKTEFTATCRYSTIQACFDDYSSLINNQTAMKSINDYVNPIHGYSRINSTRSTDGTTGTITIRVTYKYSSSYISAINNKLDQIISSENISSLSNADKIRTFHDYLINHTVYDLNAAADPTNSEYEASFTAYGALINGSAVCQGYADAMAIFFDRYRIPNLNVSSDYHTWNLVYINNTWLHLDATWDDPITSSGQQVLRTTYYLITTARLHELDTSSHEFNTQYYLEAN